MSIMWIGDMVDPDDLQGRTIKEVRGAIQHTIPVGALVEIVYRDDDKFETERRYEGVRLYVVKHSRDCDGTPLYCLCADRHDTIQENPKFWNAKWLSGFPEESLKVVR